VERWRDRGPVGVEASGRVGGYGWVEGLMGGGREAGGADQRMDGRNFGL
jgi:hypothetical protein